MYKLALALISMFFLVAAPATAAGTSEQNWVVTQLSGDARVIRPGLQSASLTVRAQLSPGDKLVTGPTGRATLVRGADYIVVAPRSEMRVPTAAQPTGFTRVVQTLGTLLFKVQHTGVPHFAVDTPMLAAVVKGTTFTVTVDQQRSAIQVTQGVVQVTAVDGGMMRLVEGGKTVFLNHLAPKVLQDADKPLLPTSPATSPTSISVAAESEAPLAAIANLTDGLLRAELTAQPAVVIASTSVATSVIETARATGAAQPTATTATGGVATPVTTTTATVSTATAAPVVSASTNVSTAVTNSVSATVAVTTTPVTSVSTPVVSTPTVAATVSTPIISTSTATITGAIVTTTAVATPSVTVPAVTTPIVSTSPVTIPAITIGTNSGPGSMNGGSGGSNSGPGSLSSGPGSGSVTVAAISTPTVTVPSLTMPIVPITTPTVTIPSVSTPTITVPIVSTVTSLLKF